MPNIIFCDGFDTYTTVLDKWDAIINIHSTNPSIQAGAGRGGAGAAFFPFTLGNFVTASQIQKNIGAQTTLFVGFAFNWGATSQTGDQAVCMFQDESTVQVTLWITPTGTMYFTRGNVPATNVLGTASIAYPSNSFHYVEIEVTISATVGVAVLKVDQTTVPGMNLTGQNTKASGNSSFDSVIFGPTNPNNQNTCACYIDDVYFDTTGFNGDVRVNGQLPSGNGSTQNFSPVEAPWAASTVTALQTTIIDSNSNLQRATAITGDFKTGGSAPTWNVTLGGSTTDNHVTWTNLGAVTHYLLVNEGNPDGDSSYVQSNTVGNIERFTYPAIPGASVVAVVIEPFARKDDGGSAALTAASVHAAPVLGSVSDWQNWYW